MHDATCHLLRLHWTCCEFLDGDFSATNKHFVAAMILPPPSVELLMAYAFVTKINTFNSKHADLRARRKAQREWVPPNIEPVGKGGEGD